MSSRETISIDEALDLVLGCPRGRGGTERVGLGESQGRVLSEPVDCAEDFPAADVSAMDGFAVRARDLAAAGALRLQGESLAGSPFSGRLAAGSCIRVMTGGLMPEGADAVVPVELSSGFEAREDGTVGFEGPAAAGDNVRPKGSVRAAGDRLLGPGTRIRPAQIGVLAQQGFCQVAVAKRPSVAVLPTGDEVVAIEETPAPGQVRNSNAHALVAQIAAAGGIPTLLPILRDREGDTLERMAEALAEHDLLCTIGGVSMGTRDLVRPAFAELGGKVLVEALRVKPGKPTLFGALEQSGHRACLLGLPGNPASSFTIFALLAVPWIRAFLGMPEAEIRKRQRASLWYSKVRANRRLQALPGRLRLRPDGVVVEELRQKSSADLFSLGEADVLFFAPENQAPRDGDLIDWVALS